MKAAAFDYVRAEGLDEAVDLLDEGGDHKLIAGGQTLVPLMAMRLSRPSLLIDIGELAELRGVRRDGDEVVVGAGTRQAAALRDPVIRASLPLLARALPWVGHPQTRNRGTIGGSIAAADPAAEIPLVAVTLGARAVARTTDGVSDLALADGFFQGPMTTALPAAACLTEIRFPVWTEARVGAGFEEVAARQSDFALVAAAAQVALDADGTCLRLAAGLGGVGGAPVRLDGIAAALVGTRLDAAAVATALAGLDDVIAPQDDPHAGAGYRRRVARTLLARAIDAAREAARP